MGKRQLGELQPSELVITILISNLATLSVENPDLPLLHGIVPMLLLVGFEIVVSWVSLRCVRIRRLLSGSPKVIIRGGVIDQDMLRRLRFSVDDLMTSLRTSGVFDLSQVQYAVVETNGTVSVCLRNAHQPAERGDIGKAGTSLDPPQIIIADGEIREQTLASLGLTDAWLQAFLREKHLTPEKIFLMTADQTGAVLVVRGS